MVPSGNAESDLLMHIGRKYILMDRERTCMNTLLNSNEALNVVKDNYTLHDVAYCMFIRRGFNDTYIVATECEKYIFRIYLNNKYFVESSSAYEFELELLKHLHSNGVPVANALPSTSGELLGWTETAQGKRAFALFSYADGIQLSGRSVTISQSYQLGKAMADLHLAANSFSTNHERYKLDFKYLIDEPLRLVSEGAKSDSSSTEPNELIKQGQQIIEKLQPIDHYVDSINRIGLGNDEFGVIHADLHPGNIHFHGDSLTMFDFDHCAYGWRAYDLAIAYGYPKAQRDSMIRGYESQRPLSSEERECLQDFANLRNLWDIGDTIATETLRAEPIN